MFQKSTENRIQAVKCSILFYVKDMIKGCDETIIKQTQCNVIIILVVLKFAETVFYLGNYNS